MSIELENINGFGGGGSSPTPPTPTPQGEYFVKVIDYDGTVLDEQWLDDGAEYTLPSAPSHDGLVFQEWSSSETITDGKITIDKSDVMIGAVYTTVSGKNEFDIELTTPTGLTVTLNIDGDKDWGDGSAVDNLTTHTYSQIGKYTIKTDGTTITSSSSSGIFGQSNDSSYCIGVRLATVSTVTKYAFQYCRSLKFITLSKDVTTIEEYAFYRATGFVAIVMPSSVTTLGQYCFIYQSSLKNIVLSNSLTSLAQYTFRNCPGLETIVIPSNIATMGSYVFYRCYGMKSVTIKGGISIGQYGFAECHALRKVLILGSSVTFNNFCFQECLSIELVYTKSNTIDIYNGSFANDPTIIEFDFSSATSVATLNSDTSYVFNLNGICKFKVPADLEASWKSNYRWSAVADYIVGV